MVRAFGQGWGAGVSLIPLVNTPNAESCAGSHANRPRSAEVDALECDRPVIADVCADRAEHRVEVVSRTSRTSRTSAPPRFGCSACVPTPDLGVSRHDARMEEPLVDPQLTAPERTAFRGFVDGEQVGEGELVLSSDDARTFTQVARGSAYGRLEGEVTARFRRRGGALLAESQSIALRHKGTVVFTEEKSFRDVQVPQLGGEVAAYPRTLIPAGGLAVALRLLPWAPKVRFTPPVWLTAIVHWPLDIRTEAKESVTTPAGTFDAYRIRIRPSLVDVAQSLDELSANVIPPVTAHIAVDSGRLLRVDFPTGAAKSDPRGYLEAVELS
jgi:hypothetical protein